MVNPRHASTIVLVRPDQNGGFEVLLTRRPEEMRFLGGFYVFPGGTVHAADYSRPMLRRCRGLPGEQAQRILKRHHQPAEALGHWVAVLRELFEEVGVLLSCNEDGTAIDVADPAIKKRLDDARHAIVRGKLDFAAFLEAENLYCDLSPIVYFDHWVTPEIYSMRFDTRFFVAVAPRDQTPLPRSEEVTHSLWIRPEEALARMDARYFPILPPTTTVLQRLARVSTWERILAEFKLPVAL